MQQILPKKNKQKQFLRLLPQISHRGKVFKNFVIKLGRFLLKSGVTICIIFPFFLIYGVLANIEQYTIQCMLGLGLGEGSSPIKYKGGNSKRNYAFFKGIPPKAFLVHFNQFSGRFSERMECWRKL